MKVIGNLETREVVMRGYGPRAMDIILDLDYRAEMDRNMIMRTGKPMGPANTANNVPQPFFND